MLALCTTYVWRGFSPSLVCLGLVLSGVGGVYVPSQEFGLVDRDGDGEGGFLQQVKANQASQFNQSNQSASSASRASSVPSASIICLICLLLYTTRPPTSSIRFTSCFPFCFCSASTAKSAPFTLCVSLSLFIAPGPIPLRLFVIHPIHPIHLKIAPRRALFEFHSLCSQRSTGLERHSLTTSTQPTPPGSTS
jgi:hypothetical protein